MEHIFSLMVIGGAVALLSLAFMAMEGLLWLLDKCCPKMMDRLVELLSR